MSEEDDPGALATSDEAGKTKDEIVQSMGFHIVPNDVVADARLDRYILDCKHWPDIVSKAQVIILDMNYCPQTRTINAAGDDPIPHTS